MCVFMQRVCPAHNGGTPSSRPGEDKDQLGKVESLAKKLLRRVTQDGAGRSRTALGYSWGTAGQEGMGDGPDRIATNC
jgi:hypothetical protein